MRTPLVILFILLTVSVFAQTKKQAVSFKKINYPASRFITKADTFSVGKVQIIITMTQPKNSSVEKFLCRSWLTIKKNNKVITQKYYDIEPVGGCSGLYTPETQPCKDYFFISKFGDYNGQTLIIDTTGKLTVLPGGPFSVSKDNHYVFCFYDSDISGITVYDLKNKKILLNKEEGGYYGAYFQDGKYFLAVEDSTNSNGVSAGYIEFNKNQKTTSIKKSNISLRKADGLKIYNEVADLLHCNCGQ